MYNLLVHGVEGAWDQAAVILDFSRFLEYTSDPIAERFGKLDESDISTLISLPTLFVYEANIDEPARVGRIKTLQRRQGEIRITFEFDSLIAPIGKDRLQKLKWDLEFGKLEMNRTHWAVKDTDLLPVLATAGLIVGGSVPVRPARRQILAAADRLSNLGHSAFDRMLLDFGIDGIKAGRDVGSLASRANALARIALDNPTIITVEGVPIGTAIIDYARRLGWSEDETTPQFEGMSSKSAVEPQRVVETVQEGVSEMPASESEENSTAVAQIRYFSFTGETLESCTKSRGSWKKSDLTSQFCTSVRTRAAHLSANSKKNLPTLVLRLS
jgi:hypothetical protein